MILGILRETKKGENRVICTPKEVETITAAGHTVYAQRGCGERAVFSDEAYASAGALLTDSVQELFKVCDMVAKVKKFTVLQIFRARSHNLRLLPTQRRCCR